MATMIKENREVSVFSRIHLKGVARLLISQGAEQKVIVEAEDFVLNRIRMDVVDGCLVIDIGRDWMERISAGFDFLGANRITITVVVQKLDALEISGAGDIEVNDLKSEDFDLRLTGASSVIFKELHATRFSAEMPGAGKLELKGKVDEQSVSLTGAGNYDAHRLESRKARVKLTGVGSAQVWVTGELELAITGVGSIEYYGNPSVRQSVTMLGSVRAMGEPRK
jgi:hypothetical protein